MPIPSEDLYKNYIVATLDTIAESLLPRLPSNRVDRMYHFVVVPVGDSRYYAILWKDIEELASRRNIRSMPISALQELLVSVEAVEQNSMGEKAAREIRDLQPGKRLVVLSQGSVIGLLCERFLSSDPTAGDDPFSFSVETFPMETNGATEKPQTLSVEEPTATKPSDQRVINAWIADMSKDEPLQLGSTYELKLNVDRPREDSLVTAGGIEDVLRQLPAEQQQVEILVVLESDDFTIYGSDQQTLIVPREGKSKNTVTFTIEPKKQGPGVVKALFITNNRVFQKMTITLQVGALLPQTLAWESQASGMTMGSVMAQPARPAGQAVNLVIIKREAGYQFIVQSTGVARAFLNLSETQIAELILKAREDLKNIVYTIKDGKYVYQSEDTAIPTDIHVASLKTLARLGYFLYQKLFYAPGNGPDAHAMGELLRSLSQQNQLHVEIVAERFIFPWALLYDRDPLDLDSVDPQGFWGFKHIVEYMPEFSSATPVNFTPNIQVSDKLGIGFVFNTTIDNQLSKAVVKAQREFLPTLPNVSVTEYPNTTDLYNLLKNPDTPAQLLYFYCHAVSNLPGDKGGVGGSKMLLSDGAVQLDELNIYAPTNRAPLKNAPLVFLNACQSAELSPYLYDGLVPYLVSRGARGVIGTEVDTPALFAAEFAQEFLRRFTSGGLSLGELLLAMRREYLTQKNNVMGLVYALYSSGDIIVQRVTTS